MSMSVEVIDCFGDIINLDSKEHTHLRSLEAVVYKINEDKSYTKLGKTKEKLDMSYTNSQGGIFHTLIRP